ncbi:hypothetical protein ABK040_014784 [Willaertia magna]
MQTTRSLVEKTLRNCGKLKSSFHSKNSNALSAINIKNHHRFYSSFNNNGSYRNIFTTLSLVSIAGGLAYYYMNKSDEELNKQEQQFSIIQEILAEESKLEGEAPPIYRIVLTGGPCSGKSTGIQKLRERLQNLGFHVFIVTEVATLLMTGGARPPADATKEQIIAFEASIIRTQMALEDCYYELAKSLKKPTILLCDRGCMDTRAYCDDYIWQAMLDTYGWTVPQLRDKRYDCVIHLVSTAEGAEEFYTLENNNVRSESVELARELDYKLRASYIGHPQVFIVDNFTKSFDEKLQRVFNILSHQIGIPRAKGVRRRFLLKPLEKVQLDVKHEIIDLEQVFLPSSEEGTVTRIVRRGQNGIYSYSYNSSSITEDGKESTKARPINARTFVNLLEQSDKTRIPIRKKIYSFVYQNHYFELNHYLNGKGEGTFILDVEDVDPGKPIELPPFLKDYVEKEVTARDNYTSFIFSKQD